MYGDSPFATAITDPSGLNATPYATVGNVDGLILAPNPETDQGYAVTNGVAL